MTLTYYFFISDKPECIKKDPVTLGVVTHRDAEVNYHINEPSPNDFCKAKAYEIPCISICH